MWRTLRRALRRTLRRRGLRRTLWRSLRRTLWRTLRRSLRRALRIGPPGAARTKDTAHVGFSDFKKKVDIGGFFSFSLRDKLPLGSKHHGRIRLEAL